jgi:hypothetical protein
VGGGGRSRENGVKKRCANARAYAREAIGSARGPEEDVPVRKQELAPRRRAWWPRRSSGRGNATWRTQGQASTGSGGRRHGRGVMRGTAGKQAVAVELLRRRAAVKHGLGRRRAAWRGEVEPARGREAAGQGLGRHVDGHRAALKWQGRRTWSGQR